VTHRQEQLESMRRRLDSLSTEERKWIIYCLFHNVQTLSAVRVNSTAQSLVHKGILEEGSGHILDLPFHIPDVVWQYLQEHSEEFLPKEAKGDQRLEKALESFKSTLHM
jgi:hypothetical protein